MLLLISKSKKRQREVSALRANQSRRLTRCGRPLEARLHYYIPPSTQRSLNLLQPRKPSPRDRKHGQWTRHGAHLLVPCHPVTPQFANEMPPVSGPSGHCLTAIILLASPPPASVVMTFRNEHPRCHDSQWGINGTQKLHSQGGKKIDRPFKAADLAPREPCIWYPC